MGKILTILFLALATSTKAQTLRQVFTLMPDSIVPLLSKVNREDGMDYLDNDMPLDVTNKLGNITTISGEKNRYIDINTASKAWTRLMLLPSEAGDTLICLVKTVSIDKARDSQIHFYDKEWKPMNTSDFVNMPTGESFMTFSDSIDEEERTRLTKKIDIPLIEISANYEKSSGHENDAPTLTFKLHSPAYMNEEDCKLVTPYIKDNIKMRWNGNRFEH